MSAILTPIKSGKTFVLKCSERSTKWKDFVEIVGNYI